jgi:UDP-N-acetylglucosamine:LPS N-acetylglucosamine transferase
MKRLEFVENYLKEHGAKLLPHQKVFLKAIDGGKTVYVSGGRHGKLILAEALREYENRKKKILKIANEACDRNDGALKKLSE